MTDPFVAGLVLAAGGKRRLGRPKPLLPYDGATLLDHAMATARACDFDQLLVAVDNDKVRERLDPSATQVASVPEAVDALDPAATALVLLRADQPGVEPGAVRVLLAGRGDAVITVSRYDDGPGHPYLFARETFAALRSVRSERDLQRLLGGAEEVPIAGRMPPGIDSWADYEAVIARMTAPGLVTTGGWRRGFRD